MTFVILSLLDNSSLPPKHQVIHHREVSTLSKSEDQLDLSSAGGELRCLAKRSKS